MTASSETGTYVKGDRVRFASNAVQVVQAKWEGFVRADQADVDVDYRDLQARAKSLGIPANQPKAKLAEAVASYTPENADPATPDQP